MGDIKAGQAAPMKKNVSVNIKLCIGCSLL